MAPPLAPLRRRLSLRAANYGAPLEKSWENIPSGQNQTRSMPLQFQKKKQHSGWKKQKKQRLVCQQHIFRNYSQVSQESISLNVSTPYLIKSNEKHEVWQLLFSSWFGWEEKASTEMQQTRDWCWLTDADTFNKEAKLRRKSQPTACSSNENLK